MKLYKVLDENGNSCGYEVLARGYGKTMPEAVCKLYLAWKEGE